MKELTCFKEIDFSEFWLLKSLINIYGEDTLIKAIAEIKANGGIRNITFDGKVKE